MKHKLLIFMAIGGAATALNFVPAAAASPTLAPPADQVCRAPVDPPTTTEPPTTSTEPATPTDPAVISDPTTAPPQGLRSNRVIAPAADEYKQYKVTITVTAGRNGRVVTINNNCGIKGLRFYDGFTGYSATSIVFQPLT